MFIFYFAFVDSKAGANVFQKHKPRAVYVSSMFSQKWGHGKKVPLPQTYVGYTEFSRNLHRLQLCCLVAAMVSIAKISMKRGKENKAKPRGT